MVNESYPLRVRHLGIRPYEPIWQSMSQFTNERDDATVDELWVVEHLPVYTQGQAGKAEHILNTTHIPIVKSDRGGQVTYHGPGQLILYPLINLRRRQLGVRDMVTLLEQLVIQWLSTYRIDAYAKPEAPGVYVALSDIPSALTSSLAISEKSADTAATKTGEYSHAKDAKIASLGLRIRRGCSFHGVSINIDMDLKPFDDINPCGYQGLAMTQLAHLMASPLPTKAKLIETLVTQFAQLMHITETEHTQESWLPSPKQS